jgi:hypothetical protein
MNHKESEVKVYVTTDYSLFKRIKGNRAINTGKIKKMVRDINHGINFLPDFPIVTTPDNSKLDIVDGQHRFEAAKNTKKPVYYIVRTQLVELDKVARLNSIQEKWKPKDFIECYIEKGIKDYQILADFQDQYELPLSVSLNLLFYGVTGGDTGAREDLQSLFHCGEFKVKHMRQAKDIAEACHQFSSFSGWNSRPFVLAISKILEADVCDFDELVQKFNADPKQMDKHSNVKACLVNLEQIFNKGYHKRRNIF